PIADLSAGNYAAVGILIALLERETSGLGQWVQTSLLQAQVAMLDFQAARWLIDNEVAGQAGNDHPTSIPTGIFPVSDGHVNIAASGGPMFKRFCEALDAPELLHKSDYATPELRSKNRAKLNADIATYTKRYSSNELINKLNAAGVPSGPIYTIDQMFADPQVKHLAMSIPLQHPTQGTVGVVNQAISLSRTPSAIDHPTPELGEHTNEILDELGFDVSAIADLRKRNVI